MARRARLQVRLGELEVRRGGAGRPRVHRDAAAQSRVRGASVRDEIGHNEGVLVRTCVEQPAVVRWLLAAAPTNTSAPGAAPAAPARRLPLLQPLLQHPDLVFFLRRAEGERENAELVIGRLAGRPSRWTLACGGCAYPLARRRHAYLGYQPLQLRVLLHDLAVLLLVLFGPDVRVVLGLGVVPRVSDDLYDLGENNNNSINKQPSKRKCLI